MVAGVLDSGLVEQAIARTRSFDPSVDLARVRTHTDLPTAEFETFGVVVPATTRNITLMRALMVPIADEALSLAVDRIWVFVTNIDDVCSKDSAEAEAVLRAGMSPGAPRLAVSPNARYIEHMFREIAGFCDPTFLAGYRTFFYSAVNGVLMESELDPDASDEDDISRIHRRAVQEGIPYLASYRHSVDSGLEAYRRVLRLANDEQRPHLERYMTAYVYWHLHCRRYRWQDVYPDLAMIDV
ncbi:hypothetical protein GCM10010222_13790 [Streptomyces tanashiensis]|nr:hypothetical protein GCM10010222_13790 [Streptomyces tanashiensis]